MHNMFDENAELRKFLHLFLSSSKSQLVLNGGVNCGLIPDRVNQQVCIPVKLTSPM